MSAGKTLHRLPGPVKNVSLCHIEPEPDPTVTTPPYIAEDDGDGVLRLPLDDVARPSPGARPMQSDLGEYRGAYTRILDDSKFQRLTPGAQAMFWVLKFKLPKVGIAAVYPMQLFPYCRWAPTQDAIGIAIEDALEELEAADWIRRHEQVVWIINALKYEQTIRETDTKHRAYVQKVVGSLPAKNVVVGEFRAYYRDWFDDLSGARKARPSEAPSKGLRRPVDVDVEVDGHRGRSIAARAREAQNGKHSGRRTATAGGRPSRLRTE